MAFSIYKRDSVRELLTSIALDHGSTMAQLVGPTQGAGVVRARREVARALRNAPYSMSTPEIGKWLGGRHHATVMNLLKKPDPTWRKAGETLQVPGNHVRRAITADLYDRLSQIERARDGLRKRLVELDQLETVLRESLERVEKVAPDSGVREYTLTPDV